jgi:hypothetical protein
LHRHIQREPKIANKKSGKNSPCNFLVAAIVLTRLIRIQIQHQKSVGEYKELTQLTRENVVLAKILQILIFFKELFLPINF